MDNQLFIDIGERIRKRRIELGYKQEYLAELIGTSPQMISFTETGRKALKLTNFIKLCSVLNVSPDYLISGREPLSVTFEGIDRLTDEQYLHVSKIIKEAIALCLGEN